MKKLFKFIFLLIFFTGCEVIPFVGPAVTGVVTWANGEATKYYKSNPVILRRSIRHALQDLDISILEDRIIEENNEYYIKAGSEDRFKISIKSVSQGITQVNVRINLMGDKPYAELIYKQIDQNLNLIEFDENGNPQHTVREIRWPTR